MRQLVLFLILGGLAIGGFMVPQIAVLGYLWYSLMRPDYLSYSSFQFAPILAGIALISNIRMLARITDLFGNPLFIALVFLQVPYLLSALFAYDPELSVPALKQFYRMLLMCLLIPLSIYDSTWFRRLMLTMSMSVGALAMKFSAYGVLAGGVVYHAGYTGMIGDNNGLALFFCMGFALCWYTSQLVKELPLKLLLQVMTFGCGTTVIFTHSRGNSIALGCLVLLIAMRSKKKMLALGLMAIAITPAIYLEYDSYAERMGTLRDVEQEASAASRKVVWKVGLDILADHPIFGVGFGEENQLALMPNYTHEFSAKVLHNTYLQIAVDSGLTGFFAHCGVLFGTIWWLGRSARKVAKIAPEWVPVPLALQGGLIAFAIGSTFYSRGDFEFTYVLLFASAAWWQVQRRLSEPTEPQLLNDSDSDHQLDPHYAAPAQV